MLVVAVALLLLLFFILLLTLNPFKELDFYSDGNRGVSSWC